MEQTFDSDLNEKVAGSPEEALAGVFQDLSERRFVEKNRLMQLELSIKLGKSQDLKEAFNTLLDAVSQIDGIDCGGVYLYNKEKQCLDLLVHRCISREFIRMSGHYPGDAPITKTVLDGFPVYRNSEEIRSRNIAEDIKEGLQAIAILPIKYKNEVIGSLNLASKRQDEFPNGIRVILETIIFNTAAAIARIQSEIILNQNKNDLHLLFNSVTDFIFIFGHDTRIVQTNKAVLDRLGFTRDEIRSMTIYDVHPESEHDLVKKTLEDLIIEKTDRCYLPLQTKNGRLIPVETKITRGVWENQEALFGVSRDISERVKAEEALNRSEERFRRIFEASPIGIVTASTDFLFLQTNDAFCRMTGYSAKELSSLTFRDITHPDHLAGDLLNVEKLIRGEIPFYRTEKRYLRKNGEVYWGLVIVSAIRNTAGKIIHMLALVENINDTKLAEKEIEKWKNHYEVVTAMSGQAVYDYRLDTGVIYWGGKTTKVLGYSSDEIGHIDKWTELIHPDEKEKVREILDDQIKNQTILDVKYRFRHKDGRYLYVHDKAALVMDAGNNPVSLVGMMQDITDMVLTQKELEEKEQQYRKLFELSPSGISLQDLDGNIMDMNDAFCRMNGFSKEELTGKNVRMLVPNGKHYHDVSTNISKILSGKTLEHEVVNVSKSGKLLHIELRDTLIRLPDGRQGILTVSNNITERKHVEDTLKESREQLKVFADHLQTVREEERVEIARELHDNLGQNLSAIKMDICMLIKKLSEMEGSDKAVEAFAQARSMTPMIDQTIDMVRKISGELRPQLLEELGLIPAIERYLEEFQNRSGISCKLSLNVKTVKVDRTHAVGIFRIIQEALTNVMRHAKATSISIRITKNKESFILEIEDNGIGIKTNKINNIKSIGILGMRERAMLIGGELSITSKRGSGTMITLAIPFKAIRK